MAQHIEIRELPQKVFKNIADSISRDVQNGGHKGSLRYERQERLIGGPDQGIFVTSRFIGKGFVYGATRGDFEVHTDGNHIKHIFLVA